MKITIDCISFTAVWDFGDRYWRFFKFYVFPTNVEFLDTIDADEFGV